MTIRYALGYGMLYLLRIEDAAPKPLVYYGITIDRDDRPVTLTCKESGMPKRFVFYKGGDEIREVEVYQVNFKENAVCP